ncbi:hypothetical protein I316_03574 [Kwoniella heveanensis BCC8398]|uniref:AAA+ ATPase domain-containing protein n=1 Tax=Kwoniella heveanensis BCC8398 TaxID=1296120 RepID=A0A1B9GU12_9TREE|nr:hypothetical protein I316_03574 [Kwoniella heveanensis BCC8398]
MRRISPSTLRQRVLPPISRRALSASPIFIRALQTSSSSLLPRSPSTRRTLIASSSAGSSHDIEDQVEHASSAEQLKESSAGGGEGEGEDSPSSTPPPNPPSDLYSYTTSIIPPSKPTSPLPAELGPALTHLYTSFLPGNQHLAEDLHPSSPFTHVISFPDGSGRPRTEPAERSDDQGSSAPEAVMALASPFEGGEAYVQDAVKRLANEMDADLVRLDLVTGLGLDGPSSPLGSKDASPPSLPQPLNPLLSAAPRPTVGAIKETNESDDSEDGHGMPGMAVTSVPIAVMGGGGGMLPSSLSGLPGMGGSEEDLAQSQVNQEWVNFFTKIINTGESRPGKKRVIVLESATAMAKSFPLWWPSLVEAVQRRRKGHVSIGKIGRNKGTNSKAPAAALLYPTSIILQCTPSLALPHTHPAMTLEHDHAESSSEEDEHAEGSADPAQAVMAALEEKFKSMGIHVQSHVEVVKPKIDGKLWWGSEEGDTSGRREGDQERLAGMLSKGVPAVLPSFGHKSLDGSSQPPVNPIRRLLQSRFGLPPRSDENPEAVPSIVWKAYPIVPQHRNLALEKEARTRQRRAWTAALLQRAVHQFGGKLADPLEVFTTSELTGLPITRKTEASGVGKGWGNSVIPWTDAMHISSIALGTAARSGQIEVGVVTVRWEDIIRARKAMEDEKRTASEQIKRHIPSRKIKLDTKTKSDIEKAPQQLLDPVVEQIKKSKNLSAHEKRLLPCIVDPNRLASTSFKDVHLPEKTIDGIRSMVSLPLLFPEAFRGGVLKDHATAGALMFGPPGTGKTLLARAVAAESGARMLAVQPSDVNDMYVGEGEKLVKAVFSLARRLSPCVIFLDEVDALFGARISRGSAGSMSHNLLLTEFMQEMDGLSSAIANKDKRIVVIGATNRPFDLDDAVLRRLPRRLLVDLPSVEDRKAILKILLRDEQLAEDVDLDKLAKETDGFSGSDLKHLCVSAALSAVKDTVQVPWAKNLAAETGVTPPETEASKTSSPTSPGGGSRAEVLVLAPTDTNNGGGGGRRKAKVTRQTAAAPVSQSSSLAITAAQPIASNSASASAATMASSSMEDQPDTGSASTDAGEQEPGVSALDGDGEGDQQIAQGEVDQLLNANKMGGDPPAESESESNDNALKDEVETLLGFKEPPPPKPRVVAWKHFRVALGEIRPSASEEGSLPELRKWAEQFGEGGKKKGKKSGFGKGFGFSEEKPNDRESEYGRVAQDEE